MLLSSVILLSSVLEQMEPFGRETRPANARAYAIHVPIEGNIQGSSSLQMLLEATGDAKWIGTSGFRRIEFSHSLIILSAVFLRVRQRDGGIYVPRLLLYPDPFQPRSPLTSELCARASGSTLFRTIPRSFLLFFLYFSPSPSRYSVAAAAAAAAAAVPTTVSVPFSPSFVRDRRKGFVKLQELFALSSPSYVAGRLYPD